MTRSTSRKLWIAGLVALVAVPLTFTVHRALAFGGRGHHEAIMRRVVTAYVDEAIDGARVTPEQRKQVHAAHDRVFRVIADTHRGRGAHLDEALRLFAADTLDRERMARMRSERQAEMQRVGDAIEQALIEVHGVLTPAQRRAVADYVAQHRPHR
jgi:uncharacterized membrane protein